MCRSPKRQGDRLLTCAKISRNLSSSELAESACLSAPTAARTERLRAPCSAWARSCMSRICLCACLCVRVCARGGLRACVRVGCQGRALAKLCAPAAGRRVSHAAAPHTLLPAGHCLPQQVAAEAAQATTHRHTLSHTFQTHSHRALHHTHILMSKGITRAYLQRVLRARQRRLGLQHPLPRLTRHGLLVCARFCQQLSVLASRDLSILG